MAAAEKNQTRGLEGCQKGTFVVSVDMVWLNFFDPESLIVDGNRFVDHACYGVVLISCKGAFAHLLSLVGIIDDGVRGAREFVY